MDLDKLRRAGEQITQAGQESLRRNVDAPLDQAREAIRKLAEAKVASQMPQPQMGASMPGLPRVQPPSEVSQVANPMPGGFTASQVAGLNDYAKLLERQKEIAAQVDADEAARAQSQAEFDPSQYQERPSRFQQLRQAVQSPRQVQPQVTVPQPIPQQGAILLSEDPEEAQRQIEAARRGQ